MAETESAPTNTHMIPDQLIYLAIAAAYDRAPSQAVPFLPGYSNLLCWTVCRTDEWD